MENEAKVETDKTEQSVQQSQPQTRVSAPESTKTKKKGHGPLYWVIVVAGVAFIVYMSIRIGEKLAKVVDPETNSSNNSNIVEESNSNIESNSVKDIDTTTAKAYIDGYKSFFSQLTSSGLTDQVKLDIVLTTIENNSSVTSESYNCSDVFNDCDNAQGHRPEGDDSYAATSNDELTTYSYATVNQQYQKLFGSNTNVATINNMPYEYSSKINAWALLSAQFGGSCIQKASTSYVIDSATEENGKILITVTYLDYSTEYPNGDCTSDKISGYSYSINGTKATVTTESEITNVITNNHDQLPHLAFTFEKDNSNYILTNVSK